MALPGKDVMGEEYRARDTKLKHDLAIKFYRMSSRATWIA